MIHSGSGLVCRSFAAHQREVIEHLLAGGDALVVMPTGSGKSLLYQLPALAGGPDDRPVSR